MNVIFKKAEDNGTDSRRRSSQKIKKWYIYSLNDYLYLISLCLENDVVNKINLLEKKSKKTFEIFAKVMIF